MNEYLAKLKTVGVMQRSWRTKDQIEEGRNMDGDRTKATTDQLGNTVTEHNNDQDRVDVTIRPETVNMEAGEVSL